MKRVFALTAVLVLAGAAQTYAKDKVMATVNGSKIRRSDVNRRLWELQGPAVLEDLISQKLIKQKAKKRKIRPDKAEVDRRIKNIEQQLPEGASLGEKLKETGGTLKSLRKNISFQVLRDAWVVAAEGISVSTQEVHAAFEVNKNRLGTPEAVHLRHIFVKTRQEAEDLLVALKAGADFAKLAAAKSLDQTTRDKGGNLGFISRGMLNPTIAEAVFALEAGQTSSVVEVGESNHIFLAVEKRVARPASFEDVAENLKQAIRRQKISNALPKLLQQLVSNAKIVR